MRRQLVVVPLLAVALAAASLAAAPVATHAAFPGANGDLVYVDFQGPSGIGHLVRYDLDTDTPIELTTDADTDYGDRDPSWSPGGTMIVFTRLDTQGKGDIWRINADGTGQKRLTIHASNDLFPTWSPDGARIAFVSDRYGQNEILTMDPNGGDVRRLTTNPADDVHPAWSSDNERIAFASDRRSSNEEFFFEIFTMSPTGAAVVRETDGSTDEAHDVAPDWDPSGSKLLFTRTSGPFNSDIWQIDTASGPAGVVIAGAGLTREGAYAPSQAVNLGRIVFQTDQLGDDWDIATVDKAGGPADILDIPDDQIQPDWQPEPVFPLVDWRFSPFANDIEWIYDMGLTGGCSVERYCPNDDVTRAQMAIFLDRALAFPPTATDYFSDDNGKTGEAAINRLAAAGITSGCGVGLYCPTAPVTRGQMAAFLDRALALAPTGTDFFTDDETSTFEANINRVAAAGITSGCGGGKYCPLLNVSRGQMAAFLRRAFE